MTKEELILAMEILIKNKVPAEAAALIWTLWMNHPSYTINGQKIVNKETGEELRV